MKSKKTKCYKTGGKVATKSAPKPMKKPQQAIDDAMLAERMARQQKGDAEEMKSMKKAGYKKGGKVGCKMKNGGKVKK